MHICLLVSVKNFTTDCSGGHRVMDMPFIFYKIFIPKEKIDFFNTLLIKDAKQSNHADIYNTDPKASKNRR